MRTFPKLFQLPFVALERVFFSLTPIDLLELAQCSTKTRQILKKSTFSGYNAELTFDVEPRERISCFIYHNLTNIQYMIRVHKAANFQFKAGQASEQKFLGKTWRMRKQEQEVEIFVASDTMQIAGWFADYCYDFFNVQPSNFDIYFHLSPANFASFKNWEGSQKAMGNWLLSGGTDTEPLREFMEWNSRGGVRRKWKIISICDVQNVKSNIFPKFSLLNTSARYIGPDVLYGLDGRVIKLSFLYPKPLLKAEHINVFIKKWLENVDFHKNLEVLVLKTSRGELGILENEVVKDIRFVKSTPHGKRYQENLTDYYNKVINHSEGRDIRRVADGKIATLMFTAQEFYFIVRH